MRVKYVRKEYCIQYPIQIHAETTSALYTMSDGSCPGHSMPGQTDTAGSDMGG